jgi:hypothetical protein
LTIWLPFFNTVAAADFKTLSYSDLILSNDSRKAGVLSGTDGNVSTSDFGVDIDTFGTYLNAELNGNAEPDEH